MLLVAVVLVELGDDIDGFVQVGVDDGRHGPRRQVVGHLAVAAGGVGAGHEDGPVLGEVHQFGHRADEAGDEPGMLGPRGAGEVGDGVGHGQRAGREEPGVVDQPVHEGLDRSVFGLHRGLLANRKPHLARRAIRRHRSWALRAEPVDAL